MPDGSSGIRVFCPPRWTVKAAALQSIATNYPVLKKLWEESLNIVEETMKCRIQGVESCMNTLEFFFWCCTRGAALTKTQ